MQNKSIKAQSMLEYLILFISVVAAGLIGTNAFMGPAMRNGLTTMQNTAANSLINNPNPPASVTSQPYYTPTRNETTPTGENKWQTPRFAGSPGGAPFEANTYYFREGPSDMSYVPAQGTVEQAIPASAVPTPISGEYNPAWSYYGDNYTGPYAYDGEYWTNYWNDWYWQNHGK